MSTVAAIDPPIQRPIPVTRAEADAAPALPSPREAPVDVVSISGEARIAASDANDAPAAAGPDGPGKLPVASVDPGYVEDMLSNLSDHNALVSNHNHVNWAKYEADFGKGRMEESRAASLKAVQASGQLIMGANSGTGVPLHTVPTDAGSNAPVAITIADFAFESGGSRYEVRAGADGAMLGTKDGQGWGSWQVAPSLSGHHGSARDSAVALQTLVQMREQGEEGASQTSRLDRRA